MPNSRTFDVAPIGELVDKYCHGKSIDPFANENRKAKITNDIFEGYKTDYNMDAVDFLGIFKDGEIDTVLFDPPYSPRQVSEVYKKCGKSVNMATTQSRFWSKIKNEIARVLKPGGVCMTFGWNSNGIGKGNGFEIVEILMVAHGGWHNDTICVVEKKIQCRLTDEVSGACIEREKK